MLSLSGNLMVWAGTTAISPPLMRAKVEARLPEGGQLLGILRDYWRATRPSHWLFPGRNPARPMTKRALQLACRRAAEAAGLSKSVTVHTLRHSFATHLLEQGVDIRVIQDLLGHRHIKTTAGYARVAVDLIRQVQSPLEHLNLAATAPD